MKKRLIAILGLVPTAAWALTPTAPTGVTVTNVSPTEQQVCWVDNSANEDGFTLQHLESGSIISVPANITQPEVCQNVTNLAPNSLNNYEVTAFIDPGFSQVAAGSGTTPPASSIVAYIDPTNGNVPVAREVKPLCVAPQDPKKDNCSADKVRKLAFPSAKGYGRFASPFSTGNWTVYKVTNLNDSGAGSFRACYTAIGPRVCVFGVSGTITLNSPMIAQDANGSNMYIAGQTSPGGIQIASGPATTSGPIRTVRTKDVVIRFLKARPGISHAPSTNVQAVSIGGQIVSGQWASSDMIVDHITANWSTDEVFSAVGVDNFTMQWSMTAEPISCGPCRTDANAQHDFSGAFVVTNNRVTMANNLIMSGLKRMPNIAGNAADVLNNVFYNSGLYAGVAYAGTYASGNSTIINYVGNWTAHGPRTTNMPDTNQKPHCIWIGREGNQAPGTGAELYVDGNICAHDLTGLANGDVAYVKQPLTNPQGGSQIIYSTPRAGGLSAPVTDATTALTQVLNWAGARQNMQSGAPVADAVEQRSIDQVRNCDNHVYTPTPGRITAIPSPGYPVLSGTSPADTDIDGMSDAWEVQYFTNLARDGRGDFDGDGWYDLEEYLNYLAGEGVEIPEGGSLPAPNCSWPAQ